MASRTRRHVPVARHAAIAAVLVSAGLVAVLAGCPPSRPASTAGPAPLPGTPRQVAPQAVPPAGSPGGGSASPSVPSHAVPERGLLTVVLDDAGYSLADLDRVLEVPGTLTVAVLPNLPHSTEAARRVKAAGKDLIVHFPMGPLGEENPGPGAIYAGMSAQEVEGLLDAGVATVPGAIGMNNHMGSRATADAALMDTVARWLAGRGLLFLDSRTTADTGVPAAARRAGITWLERDVFVDVGTGRDEVDAAFLRAVSEAREKGSAVVIGHVQNPAVAAILRAELPGLAARGVRLASLAEVAARRGAEGTR